MPFASTVDEEVDDGVVANVSLNVPNLASHSLAKLREVATTLVSKAGTTQRRSEVVQSMVTAAYDVGGATWDAARKTLFSHLLKVRSPSDRESLCMLLHDASVVLRRKTAATQPQSVSDLLGLVLPVSGKYFPDYAIAGAICVF